MSGAIPPPREVLQKARKVFVRTNRLHAQRVALRKRQIMWFIERVTSGAAWHDGCALVFAVNQITSLRGWRSFR
jgi:hypothetical protein